MPACFVRALHRAALSSFMLSCILSSAAQAHPGHFAGPHHTHDAWGNILFSLSWQEAIGIGVFLLFAGGIVSFMLHRRKRKDSDGRD